MTTVQEKILIGMLLSMCACAGLGGFTAIYADEIGGASRIFFAAVYFSVSIFAFTWARKIWRGESEDEEEMDAEASTC